MMDIVTAVNEMIRFGNISAIFSPVSDEGFLAGTGLNFLSESPRKALRKANFKKVCVNFIFIHTVFQNMAVEIFWPAFGCSEFLGDPGSCSEFHRIP